MKGLATPLIHNVVQTSRTGVADAWCLLVNMDVRATNLRDNLVMALRNLAIREQLLRYKAAVPFVHIPIELGCQWDEHERALAAEASYLELFTPAERDALDSLGDALEVFFTAYPGDDMPDVPEVLEDPSWMPVMEMAALALERLASRVQEHGQ